MVLEGSLVSSLIFWKNNSEKTNPLSPIAIARFRAFFDFRQRSIPDTVMYISYSSHGIDQSCFLSAESRLHTNEQLAVSIRIYHVQSTDIYVHIHTSSRPLVQCILLKRICTTGQVWN